MTVGALEARGLIVRRGVRTILREVSFRVPPGTALILTGPNGAGKSTLLRALAGLMPLDGGDATIGDVSLRDDPGAFGAHVGWLGHLDALKPTLTVRETLVLHAALHGGRPVEGAIGQLALNKLADRPARSLSAGQKRRLAIARLLVAGRPLWLLDEPTVSLDAATTEAVAELMRAHCADGGLLIAATHIDLRLPEAERLDLTPEPEAARGGPLDPVLTGDAW